MKRPRLLSVLFSWSEKIELVWVVIDPLPSHIQQNNGNIFGNELAGIFPVYNELGRL